jgi:uncharacterized protein
MPERLQILHYDYVPDIADKRGPHREAHLALIGSYHADGRLVIAGAVGDPPHAGLFGFRDEESARAFAAEDPYGQAGLVVEASYDPWNVVTPLP